MNPRVLAYLQLFRLPNVFTAVADVVMGFLFVQLVGGPYPISTLLLLVASSCLLYTAGMVLNDVFDFEVDAKERPHRPLPSGRINLPWARKLGQSMLAAGVVLAWFASPTSGMVALLLAVAIYAYDGLLKKTPVAPIVMGSCRFLNVLLGMSCATTFLQPDQLIVACGLGMYVAGITWFARCEAKDSDRRMLTFGFAVMMLGIAVLGSMAWFTEKRLLVDGPFMWLTLLTLIMISVVRRCVTAIANPLSEHVQQAVKHSIFTLVVLDAAVVLAIAGAPYAIAVLCLLIPTTTLGRWVYST